MLKNDLLWNILLELQNDVSLIALATAVSIIHYLFYRKLFKRTDIKGIVISYVSYNEAD